MAAKLRSVASVSSGSEDEDEPASGRRRHTIDGKDLSSRAARVKAQDRLRETQLGKHLRREEEDRHRRALTGGSGSKRKHDEYQAKRLVKEEKQKGKGRVSDATTRAARAEARLLARQDDGSSDDGQSTTRRNSARPAKRRRKDDPPDTLYLTATSYAPYAQFLSHLTPSNDLDLPESIDWATCRALEQKWNFAGNLMYGAHPGVFGRRCWAARCWDERVQEGLDAIAGAEEDGEVIMPVLLRREEEPEVVEEVVVEEEDVDAESGAEEADDDEGDFSFLIKAEFR